MRNLIENFIHELSSSTQQEIRSGHALALGVLPKFSVLDHKNDVIGALIKSLEITPMTVKWAESRRDSIKALASLVVTLEEEIDNGRRSLLMFLY